jgi:hypothetical protein
MKVFPCSCLLQESQSVQESLGFNPFEHVYGHAVSGPLKILKEKFLFADNSYVNLLMYVSDLRKRFYLELVMFRDKMSK